MSVIRNATPHPIHLMNEAGELVREFPVEHDLPCPRVSVVERDAGSINDAPVIRQAFGEVTNLPEPVEGVYYIVSVMVQSACPDRHDLVIPARLVRDATGRIIGCRAFAAQG